MMTIARSRLFNAANSCRSSSIGGELARPMIAGVRQLTAAAMAIANHSSPRQVPLPLHPAADPIWRSNAHLAADCPQLSNPHSSSAPHRCAHAGPRFPPSRLIRRLPTECAALPSDQVTGRRLITLNDSGPSRPRPGTGKFDPKRTFRHMGDDACRCPFADMDGARLLQCTRLIQRGTKYCGNLCRHRWQCPQAGRWPFDGGA